nr:TetR family transcriptional regulator [Streptomyces sp. DSM 41633]
FNGYVGLEAAGGFSHSAPSSQESWTEILNALDALLRNWPAPAVPG